MINYKIIGDTELIFKLNLMSNKIPDNISNGIKDIAKHLHDEVKDKFGSYQQGWPKLKRASVIAKYKRRSLKGFNRPKLNNKSNTPLGADDPLVLNGELFKSIKKSNTKKEAKIYSDNPYAAVHEYGYAPKNIPARSYMRLTLMQEEDEIIRIMDRQIKKVIR